MSASFGLKTHWQSPQWRLCVLWFCPQHFVTAVTYFVVVLDNVWFLSCSRVFVWNTLSSVPLTEGFLPSDRPGNPCSLVLLFFYFYFFRPRAVKRELCSLASATAYPTHTRPVQTWALPQSLFPPPPLRFLHLSLYSMTVFLLYPAPSTLFSTHTNTHPHTQAASCAPEQTVAYAWPQLSLHLFF